MDAGKLLYPESGELIINGDDISAKIIDAELDPIIVGFHYDDCVKLNTKELEWITLSRENLCNLLDLLDESEMKFKEILK